MSTTGSRKPRAGLRPWLGGWLLIILFLHSACATGLPMGGTVLGASYRHRPLTPEFYKKPLAPVPMAEAEEDEGSEDGLVSLSLPTRFDAVQVSEAELDEVLAILLLNMPLRVASSRVPIYLNRMMAQASVPLRGDKWRTPLSHTYGLYCERIGTPGDCLELFEDGPGLDDKDKRDIALALAVTSALEARDAELRSMFSTAQLMTTVSLTIVGYMALVAAPEPVSKGVAAALALLMWGYLGWELFDLVRAWFRLWEEAAEASSFSELREAGERFGKVIGPNSVRILLMLGTAAVGSTASLVNKAPSLPGFTRAAAAAESNGGLRNILVAAQEADKVMVAVAEGTFTVVLPANVVTMAARGTATRAPVPRKPEVHHIATIENNKSTARGGPWTPRFKILFDKAGMPMKGPANEVLLNGHKGPHPEKYHAEVHERLRLATEGCRSTLECRNALVTELRRMAQELSNGNSKLYKLLTESAPR